MVVSPITLCNSTYQNRLPLEEMVSGPPDLGVYLLGGTCPQLPIPWNVTDFGSLFFAGYIYIYSQKYILKIISSKIMFFLKFLIARI
jgi:hypothetical protein